MRTSSNAAIAYLHHSRGWIDSACMDAACLLKAALSWACVATLRTTSRARLMLSTIDSNATGRRLPKQGPPLDLLFPLYINCCLRHTWCSSSSLYRELLPQGFRWHPWKDSERPTRWHIGCMHTHGKPGTWVSTPLSIFAEAGEVAVGMRTSFSTFFEPFQSNLTLPLVLLIGGI